MDETLKSFFYIVIMISVVLGATISTGCVIAGVWIARSILRTDITSEFSADINARTFKFVVPAGLLLVIVGLLGLYLFTANRNISISIGEIMDFRLVDSAYADDLDGALCESKKISAGIKLLSGQGDQEAELLLHTLNDLRHSVPSVTTGKHGELLIKALQARGDLVDVLRLAVAKIAIDRLSMNVWCDIELKHKTLHDLNEDELMTYHSVDNLLNQGLAP